MIGNTKILLSVCLKQEDISFPVPLEPPNVSQRADFGYPLVALSA